MILIAIGANLPAPDGAPALATCQRAAQRLAELPGLRLVALSSWYETAPMPPSGQPSYINGVARLEGEIAPAQLLVALQEIEAANGRRRSVPNAARTLDLDIVDLNGAVRDSPDPVLPHPRADQRAFVLVPLEEIAPNWVHPRLGRSVQALISALPPQEIRRI